MSVFDDAILVYIRSTLGVEPFSRAFIFGDRYAKQRNGIVRGDPSRTLLSIALDSMNAVQRAQAFPSRFDLGNCREASHPRPTIEDLADELSGEASGDAATVTPGSFRTIEQWILEITGHQFREHLAWNPVKALKVLKLIYLLQRDRQSSILRLIRPVRPGKGSFEHRHRYPLVSKDHNERQVWLLADLTSYLGIELNATRRHLIETTCSDLLHHTEEYIHSTELSIKHRYALTPGLQLQAYISEIAKIKQSYRITVNPISHDLDELLFIHVLSLPFEHFAAASEYIVAKTLPNITITPVGREINKLAFLQTNSDGVETMSQSIAINNVFAFYKASKRNNCIQHIVAMATGHSINPSSYDELSKRSVELLSRYVIYKNGKIDPDTHMISLLWCVTAMCAVWLETCEQTEYRPYWMGQMAQGRRILGFLDQPFLEQGSPLHTSYPEAIDQVWVQRLEWMVHALQGRQELGVLKAKHKVAVLKRIASYLASGEINTTRVTPRGTPGFRASS